MFPSEGANSSSVLKVSDDVLPTKLLLLGEKRIGMSPSNSPLKKSREASGRSLSRHDAVDLDVDDVKAQKTRATELSKVASTYSYYFGDLVASNEVAICYVVKSEMVRVIFPDGDKVLLKGHLKQVFDIRFANHNPYLLATACKGGRILVWNMKDKSEVPVLSLQAEPEVFTNKLSWHPTIDVLAVALSNEKIHILPVEALIQKVGDKDALLGSLEGVAEPLECGSQIHDIMFSTQKPNNLVVANQDGMFRVFNWETKSVVWEMNGHDDAVLHAARYIRPGGQADEELLITGASRCQELKLWDLAKRECIGSLKFSASKSGENAFYSHVIPVAAIGECVLVANAKRKDFHCLHIGKYDGVWQFDYISCFDVSQSILSGVARKNGGAISLFCVQPKVVQEFVLEPLECWRTPAAAAAVAMEENPQLASLLLPPPEPAVVPPPMLMELFKSAALAHPPQEEPVAVADEVKEEKSENVANEKKDDKAKRAPEEEDSGGVVAVQSGARGFLARRALNEEKKDAPTRDEAAAIVQAAGRAFLARRVLKEQELQAKIQAELQKANEVVRLRKEEKRRSGTADGKAEEKDTPKSSPPAPPPAAAKGEDKASPVVGPPQTPSKGEAKPVTAAAPQTPTKGEEPDASKKTPSKATPKEKAKKKAQPPVVEPEVVTLSKKQDDEVKKRLVEEEKKKDAVQPSPKKTPGLVKQPAAATAPPAVPQKNLEDQVQAAIKASLAPFLDALEKDRQEAKKRQAAEVERQKKILQILQTALESTIPKAVENAVTGALDKHMGKDGVAQALQSECRKCFVEMVAPRVEKGVNAALAQAVAASGSIAGSSSSAPVGRNAGLEELRSDLKVLQAEVRGVVGVLLDLSKRVTESVTETHRSAMEAQKTALASLLDVSARLKGADGLDAARVGSPSVGSTASGVPPSVRKKSLMALVLSREYNAAFVDVLSLKDRGWVMWLLKKINDPEKVFSPKNSLEQPVLLSFVQQLGAMFPAPEESMLALQLAWMQSGLLVLDIESEEISAGVNDVLSVLLDKLQREYPNFHSTPTQVLFKLTMHVINSLLR